MKKTALILASLGTLAVGLPLSTTTASAEFVRKSVYSNGECRTVRTAVAGHGHRHVIVKRVCR